MQLVTTAVPMAALWLAIWVGMAGSLVRNVMDRELAIVPVLVP